jgi:hypothetical protein
MRKQQKPLTPEEQAKWREVLHRLFQPLRDAAAFENAIAANPDVAVKIGYYQP